MIFNDSRYNQNWKIKTLSQLGDFQRGVSKHRPRNDRILFENGHYPLVQTGEIKDATLYVDNFNAMYNDYGLQQSKLWEPGTLCITIAANIAESAILARPMCFPDSVVGFLAYPDETTPEFMYYIFEYIKQQIQKRTIGSIQDNINIDYLTLLQFRIPDYQNKIVGLLSGIDKKILLNNRVNATLEAMAKTLYDYWFVQFDFPDEKGRPYKTSGGKMVYNEELGREIPAGWEVVPLPQVASLQYGYPLSTDMFCNEGIPVIRIRDIIDNSTSASTNESVHVQYLTEKGDLLVGMDGNFQMNYWTRDGEIVNQRITRIRKKEIPIMIIRFQIEPFITAKITNVARSTVGHLGDTDFKERLIIVPSNLDMSVFDTVIDKIISYRNENHRLAALRDWLLPMLMNGQVGFRREV